MPNKDAGTMMIPFFKVPASALFQADSSNIEALAHLPSPSGTQGILVVVFKSATPAQGPSDGTIGYTYENVSYDLYTEIASAESVGKAFNRRIRDAKDQAGRPLFPGKKVLIQKDLSH